MDFHGDVIRSGLLIWRVSRSAGGAQPWDRGVRRAAADSLPAHAPAPDGPPAPAVGAGDPRSAGCPRSFRMRTRRTSMGMFELPHSTNNCGRRRPSITRFMQIGSILNSALTFDVRILGLRGGQRLALVVHVAAVHELRIQRAGLAAAGPTPGPPGPGPGPVRRVAEPAGPGPAARRARPTPRRDRLVWS